MRASVQRQVILETLQKHHDHPTAEVLYSEVRDILPRVSLGTVYRNLKLMAENGIIQRLRSVDGPDHFDPETRYHHHFFCIGCGAVEDLPEGSAEAVLNLPESYSSRRDIRGASVIVIGQCPSCRDR